MIGVRGRLFPTLLLALLVAWPLPAVAADPSPLEPARLSWDGPKPPWLARRRGVSKVLEPTGHGLRDLTRWPEEPPTPGDITVEALAAGLKVVCPSWMPPKRPARYAGWILERSREFGVDPLVVAGLLVTQGGCDPRHATDAGVGVAGIYPKMHLSHLEDRRYRYQVFDGGTWDPRELDLSRFLFYERALRTAEASIYFAAALLRISGEQCPHNDGAFASVPHRHPVSHVVWGDRVRGTDGEAQVLLARRRLIEHLVGDRADLRGALRGLTLLSPLDGAPRRLTSGFGDDRDEGRRRHQGVDFYSTHGEPVRAVADGTVTFAGAGWRGGGASHIAPAALAKEIDGRALANAGVYIKIDHGDDVLSAYMHLADITVRRGETVRAGQLIGHVGRTGIKASPQHLHFELRVADAHVDPLPHLGPMVFEPDATWRGWRIAWELARTTR